MFFNCHVPHCTQIQRQCAYNAFSYKLLAGRTFFPLALAEGWRRSANVYLTPSLKIVLIKINISVRECGARCPAERGEGGCDSLPRSNSEGGRDRLGDRERGRKRQRTSRREKRET